MVLPSTLPGHIATDGVFSVPRTGGEHTALASVSLGASVSESQWAAIEPDVLLPVEEVWPISPTLSKPTPEHLVEQSSASVEPARPSGLEQPSSVTVNG